MSDAPLATCPKCAEEVKPEAQVCKHCGHYLHGRSPAFKTAVAVIVIAAVAGAVLFWRLTIYVQPLSDRQRRLEEECKQPYRDEAFGRLFVDSTIPLADADRLDRALTECERKARSSPR